MLVNWLARKLCTVRDSELVLGSDQALLLLGLILLCVLFNQLLAVIRNSYKQIESLKKMQFLGQAVRCKMCTKILSHCSTDVCCVRYK